MLRSMLLCVASLALAGCQTVYFAAINTGARPALDAAYGDLPEQRLDVYRPPGGGPAPIVVFVYGGAWQTGSRAQYAFVGRALAQQGLVAVVADYRHGPGAPFPAFVEDVARAVRWTHDHAGEIGGDASRLFLAGHSAGAHIAALLATDARYLAAHGLAPGQLAGVVAIAGPYDFLPITDPALQRVFGDRSRWPDSQPVNFVDGDEPPFLLLHGATDQRVWPRNSERLAAKLRAAGVPAELRIYPEVGHARILAALKFESLAPTLADTVAFVRR